MRYAQLNPVGLVMNIVDLTPDEAARLTTIIIPLLPGEDEPPPGHRFMFGAPKPDTRDIVRFASKGDIRTAAGDFVPDRAWLLTREMQRAEEARLR